MATAKKAAPTDSAAPATGLPLFFQKPAVVEKDRHAKASISEQSDLSFARGTNSIPLNGIEFMEAVKSFPIVFTNTEAPMPVALVGLEKENYFVGADGKWLAGHYIPAYVRQYPFVLFEQDVADKPDEKQMFLCVDEASSQFHTGKAADAMPLYTDEGKASVMAERALEFCGAVFQHHAITRNFCADLKKHNLLSPYQTKVELKSGKSINIGGFLAIEEKNFNELPEDVFLDFRKKGWLPLIYLALVSGTNWKVLAEHAEKSRAH